MKLVTEDQLGIGLPAVIPKGSRITLKIKVRQLAEAFDLDEDALLHESEGEYLYSPAVGLSFTFPAELIQWDDLPQYGVMKPNGSPFHRSASDAMTQALQGPDSSALLQAMYRLNFVRKTG